MNNNIEKIKEVLVREGATILAMDDMGMRRLAYPVKKYERGVYTVVYYKAPGKIISEFERILKFNEEVLKYLTVRHVKLKEIAQFERTVASLTGKEEDAKKMEETSHV